MIGSSAIVPFFSSDEVLPFADQLLASSGAPNENALLIALYTRLDSLPPSSEFDQLWTKHFSVFVKSSASANEALREAADRILIKGSSSLLLSSTTMPSLSRNKSTLPFAQWTSSILSRSTDLSRAQATVLSALVSRSSEARQEFIEHIQSRSEDDFDPALELPLKSVLEVAVVRKEEINIDESVSKSIIKSVLNREVIDESSLAVVELLSTISPAVDSIIRSTLEENLASTERDGYKASTVALIGRLAEKDQGLKSALEGYVNGSFEGLTRKFVDAKEDEEVEKALSISLRESVTIYTFVASSLMLTFTNSHR